MRDCSLREFDRGFHPDVYVTEHQNGGASLDSLSRKSNGSSKNRSLADAALCRMVIEGNLQHICDRTRKIMNIIKKLHRMTYHSNLPLYN